MFPTPTLQAMGPLTTLFNPPASCIYTTTVLGSAVFIGYHPDLGTDSACFPPISQQSTSLPSITSPASSASFPAITTPPTLGGLGIPTLLRYYSPGICPVGYAYHKSYPVPASIGDASSTTAYVCCPTGYGVKISYVSFNSYDTLWPLCTGQATVISSAWRLVPGWPTIQPTSLDLFTTTAIGDYAWFTPLASAMVVAWQSTDSTVIQYLDTARIYLPVPSIPGKAHNKPHRHLSEPAIIALGVVGFFVLFFGLSGFCMYRARNKGSLVERKENRNESFELLTRNTAPVKFNGVLPIYSDMMLNSAGQSAASREAPPHYEDALDIVDSRTKLDGK